MYVKKNHEAVTDSRCYPADHSIEKQNRVEFIKIQNFKFCLELLLIYPNEPIYWHKRSFPKPVLVSEKSLKITLRKIKINNDHDLKNTPLCTITTPPYFYRFQIAIVQLIFPHPRTPQIKMLSAFTFTRLHHNWRLHMSNWKLGDSHILSLAFILDESEYKLLIFGCYEIFTANISWCFGKNDSKNFIKTLHQRAII